MSQNIVLWHIPLYLTLVLSNPLCNASFNIGRSIIIKPSRLEKSNCTCPHQVHNVKKFAFPCTYSNTKYKYITKALSRNKPWLSIAKLTCFMSFKVLWQKYVSYAMKYINTLIMSKCCTNVLNNEHKLGIY
jgi:hypothetical protein